MKRIVFLDELRGFLVFCMVFFHAFFTFGLLFNMDISTKLYDFFLPFEIFFAGAFIVISGMCSAFSGSNIKRGIKLFVISLLLSLVMYLGKYIGFYEPIWFGILHMLSISMILFGLCERIFTKINPYIGMCIFGLLFIITYGTQNGHFWLVKEIPLPDEWYNKGLFALGFCDDNFFSSDFFPLFPWMFLFFAAGFLGMLIKNKTLPAFFYKDHMKAFSFLGRNSLLIYLVHQPVIYLIGTLFL